MLVPRPAKPTQTPEDAMMASMDETVTCPICRGAKTVTRVGEHAGVVSFCTACRGHGTVTALVANQIKQMSQS